MNHLDLSARFLFLPELRTA